MHNLLIKQSDSNLEHVKKHPHCTWQPFIRSKLDEQGNIKDPQLKLKLGEVVQALLADIDTRQ